MSLRARMLGRPALELRQLLSGGIITIMMIDISIIMITIKWLLWLLLLLLYICSNSSISIVVLIVIHINVNSVSIVIGWHYFWVAYMGSYQRGVQSEGGAVDGGSIVS